MKDTILITHPARAFAAAFGARGAVRSLSNACATGTTALAMAMEDIRYGGSTKSLVLGCDIFAYFIQCGFACLKALSREPCRPFDRDRNGLNLGEAGAAIILEKAEDDKGVQVLGYGISNDAHHITGPSRTGKGLCRAIEMCLSDAGISPGQVGAIMGHGTATLFNDSMEMKAYKSIFQNHIPPICGAKGAIGHTLGAAGVVESVLAALMVEKKAVPPTAGNNHSNHKTVNFKGGSLDTPIVLNCNSGFGGVNTAVLIGTLNE